MIIGGLEKLTLIDYPGEVAAIIFTQGCNFRCQFCYNPMLVWPTEVSELKYERDHSTINKNDLFDFLIERKGKLDAVVITGGEPTLQADLPEFIAEIRALGYKIKLDTNGTNPAMLERILKAGLVDYLAMDIKAPLAKYSKVVEVETDLENIQKSIGLIMQSGIPYEFRTTLVPGLHQFEDIAQMGAMIKGAAKWYFQFFKSDTELVNREFEAKERFMPGEMAAMAAEGQKWVEFCEVRG